MESVMAINPIDAKTLKHWLERGEAVLVDVREPAEHAAQHIAGAACLPLGDISVQKLPEAQGKKLVLHCQGGKRSTSACQKLLADNPQLELYNLEGGMMAWNALGEAVQESGKKLLPLDRQVQLTIGLILLVASVLGALFGPVFFLLTGMIGAGLSVAGLTGFCGLAMVIAKMPWNQRTK